MHYTVNNFIIEQLYKQIPAYETLSFQDHREILNNVLCRVILMKASATLSGSGGCPLKK